VYKKIALSVLGIIVAFGFHSKSYSLVSNSPLGFELHNVNAPDVNVKGPSNFKCMLWPPVANLPANPTIIPIASSKTLYMTRDGDCDPSVPSTGSIKFYKYSESVNSYCTVNFSCTPPQRQSQSTQINPWICNIKISTGNDVVCTSSPAGDNLYTINFY